MTNWIKHTPGQPCPVPIEWVKAVRRAAGDKCKISGGKIFYMLPGNESYARSILDFEEAFCEDWQHAPPPDHQITHFKLKKQYRALYKQQQEQAVMTNTVSPAEPSMYQPGEDSTDIEPPHGITRTESTTVTVSCGDRSATYDKAIYDEHQELIDAWVAGGDIETKTTTDGWIARVYPNSQPDVSVMKCGNYRIKPREPKAGEVWIDEMNQAWLAMVGDDGFVFVSIAGACWCEKVIGSRKYSAPSVEAYIARKLWGEKCNPDPAGSIAPRVSDACRHGE